MFERRRDLIDEKPGNQLMAGLGVVNAIDLQISRACSREGGGDPDNPDAPRLEQPVDRRDVVFAHRLRNVEA